MTVKLRSAARTDVGKARERNEDACFAGRHVFAVADGLGGHRAGEVASTVALGVIAPLDEMDPDGAAGAIADGVRRANHAVFERADADAGLRGMGTTITAVAVHDGKARLAHVGDSRCYLIRAGEIAQLSRDHTLVARMISEGKLTPEQAEVHPQRSMLTRALGADRDIDVEELDFDLEPGDRLLLCSDGLTTMLSDEEIRTLATEGDDLEEVCGNLIEEANARGGLDNITAVVVDVAGTWEAAVTRVLKRPASRRVPRRALVWAAVVVAVALGGFFGVRAWAHRSFYVGVEGGRVVIFRGLPVEVGPIRLAEVEEPTQILLDQVAPDFRENLREGVRARSLAEACRIVGGLPVSPPPPPLPPVCLR